MNTFPSKKELMDAVITIFKEENKTILSTKEINDKVATLLNIPDELLQIEDSNCCGTEYGYRMRWVRTELKNKKILRNSQRGYWEFSQTHNQ